jgi:ABC-type Fe3+-citrate transport system substrate-binding protein
MSKQIKLIITLLTTLLFLTACSSKTSEDSNPDIKQETQNSNLEEKISNKQQYIVIQEYIYESTMTKNKKTQEYIEDKANFMNSKNYKLIQQDMTSDKFGSINYLILTFEYKGD